MRAARLQCALRVLLVALPLLLPFLPLSLSSSVHLSLARRHEQRQHPEALSAVNNSVSSTQPPGFLLGRRGEVQGEAASSSLTSSPTAFPPAAIDGPFLHPLLSVGSVVSAPHRPFLPRPQFELLEFLRPIPVPAAASSLRQSAASAAAGLLPFASTSLSPFVASPSSPHPLLLPDHALPLSQLERIAASSAVSPLLPAQREDDRREAGLTPSVSLPDTADGSFSSSPFEYELQSQVGRGGYGELWKARRLRQQAEAGRETEAADEAAASSGSELFVLKRLLLEKGEDVRLSGVREMHFGSLLRLASAHIARFLDAFELDGELWLVFRYEGVSLRAYTSAFEAGGRRVLSDEWRMLRMEMMTEEEKADWRLQQRRRRQTRDGEAAGCYDEGCDELSSIDLDEQQQASGEQTASLPSPPLAASHALSFLQANVSCPAASASDSSSSSSSPSSSSSALRAPPGSLLRELLSQLFSGVAAGHRLGVTHRDLKPDNVLLRLHRHHPHHSYRLQQPGTEHDFLSLEEEEEEEQADRDAQPDSAQREFESPAASLPQSPSAPDSSLPAPSAAASFFRQPSSWSSLGHVRLCDYGSGIDAVEETNSRLYPQRGPSPLESSLDYAPPELLFFSSTQQQQQEEQQPAASSPLPSLSSFFQPSYDSWSLGVLMLELLLGSRSRVFALDARLKAVVQQRIGRAASEQVKEKAVLFRALVDYCVYEATSTAAAADARDGGGDGDGDALPAAAAVGRCNHTRVAEMLRRYDPMALGLGDLGALMPDGEEEEQQQRAAEAEGATWLTGSSHRQRPPLSLLFYLLLRRLLQWDPQRRLAVEEAQQHAYFHGDLLHCQLCPLSFELPGLLHAHLMQQHRQQQQQHAGRARH